MHIGYLLGDEQLAARKGELKSDSWWLLSSVESIRTTLGLNDFRFGCT